MVFCCIFCGVMGGFTVIVSGFRRVVRGFIAIGGMIC